MPTDLRELALNDGAALKVSGESKPQSVARAIGHVWRESPSQRPPSVTAIGPQAINQAIKAIAIARRQASTEGTLTTGDLTVRPVFEGELRAGATVAFQLEKCVSKIEEPAETDDNTLSAKPSTDAFKLAGAIAGRMRESKQCAILVKGAVPVLIAVKAIAKAQEYLAADAASQQLAFTAALVDRENRDLRNAPKSTFTALSVVALPAAAASA